MRSVLRLQAGDTVRVFDGLEPVDRVVALGADLASGHVEGSQPQAAEPRTRLVAYPALLQRDKFEPVLQKLTELGVAAIVPLITDRSLVRQPGDEHRQMRWSRSCAKRLSNAGEAACRRWCPPSHLSKPWPRPKAPCCWPTKASASARYTMR